MSRGVWAQPARPRPGPRSVWSRMRRQPCERRQDKRRGRRRSRGGQSRACRGQPAERGRSA